MTADIEYIHGGIVLRKDAGVLKYTMKIEKNSSFEHEIQ